MILMMQTCFHEGKRKELSTEKWEDVSAKDEEFHGFYYQE